MNYKQLIENTIVPGIETQESKVEKYKELITYINDKIPSKLYRFRNISEKNISALYNDELWFANATMMNDDYDARLYYDKKEIIKWLKSFLSEDGSLKPVLDFLKSDEIPNNVKTIIPNANDILSFLKTLSKDQIQKTSFQTMQFILDNLDCELDNITHQIQKSSKFACFSEKIYSDMMWGQYSCNATGFALEYEFGKQMPLHYNDDRNRNSDIWGQLYPILYGNYRFNTTDYAKYLFQVRMLYKVINNASIFCTNEWVNSIVPCPDEFMITKVAINKSNDWKQEGEWRMFYITNNPLWAGEEYSCVHHKVSGIYLGRKISKINQKIIMDIAKEKKIPVYKMDLNSSARSYKLRSRRIF